MDLLIVYVYITACFQVLVVVMIVYIAHFIAYDCTT